MAMVDKYVFFRLPDKSVEIDVSWEKSSVCPSQEFSIEASGFRTVNFYTRPSAINCGKSSVVASAGAMACDARRSSATRGCQRQSVANSESPAVAHASE